jgi:two-component system NtrC family sensor kinase
MPPLSRPEADLTSPDHGIPPMPTDEAVQREKLSVIGHMTSSIAHDLSNPLATIVTSIQGLLAFWPRFEGLLAQSAEPAGDESARRSVHRLKEDLELILGEARRAGNIVTNLLALARNQPPERGPVSLAEVIRQTVSVSQHHLNQHGIVIHADPARDDFGDPDWCWVHGDPNRLQQILLNLIINAQQAVSTVRPSGTVWVRIWPEPGQRVSVAVEDDGPGIPPTLHEAIFNAYYTTKPNGQGTGLGLSIATGIIMSHGGELSVSDREECGARFVMTLPVTSGERSRITATLPPTEPRPVVERPVARGKVLLVDDEAGIRRSVGRFLRRCGCEVATAPTGSEAIEALRQSDFNLIISDIRMPSLGGEELFAHVERDLPHLTSRIVFVSGDMMRRETREFLERCGCPSLQKPYELSDLMRIIEEFCPAIEPAASNPGP